MALSITWNLAMSRGQPLRPDVTFLSSKISDFLYPVQC